MATYRLTSHQVAEAVDDGAVGVELVGGGEIRVSIGRMVVVLPVDTDTGRQVAAELALRMRVVAGHVYHQVTGDPVPYDWPESDPATTPVMRLR